MSRIWLAVAGLILALAAVSFYQYQKIDKLQLVLAGNAGRIASLETGLSTLKSQDVKNRAAIERLLTQQGEISQRQVEQQNAFTRLQNDYATVNDWSNVLLPIELTSLLNRPARTGYSGFSPAMRPGDAMPATGSPDTKKR